MFHLAFLNPPLQAQISYRMATRDWGNLYALRFFLKLSSGIASSRSWSPPGLKKYVFLHVREILEVFHWSCWHWKKLNLRIFLIQAKSMLYCSTRFKSFSLFSFCNKSIFTLLWSSIPTRTPFLYFFVDFLLVRVFSTNM